MEEKEIKIALPKTYSEYELLFRLVEKVKLERTQKTTDYYYDTQDLFYTQNDHGLRVRTIDTQAIDFTFKALFHLPARKNPWYIEEQTYPFPIEDLENMKNIFKRLNLKFYPEPDDNKITHGDLDLLFHENGLSHQIVINKHRSIFSYKDAQICVDDTKELGVFIEIETIKSNPQKIATELKLLELGTPTKEGYPILLAKKRGLLPKIDKTKLYQKNPTWNVLENEKKIYNKLTK